MLFGSFLIIAVHVLVFAFFLNFLDGTDNDGGKLINGEVTRETSLIVTPFDVRAYLDSQMSLVLRVTVSLSGLT